ncbi:BPSL0067 family protein [Undibacterium sp. Jales W-56]|uniref:BPSL0067 family protein n=1 Tax=Undibacterium sp. Jales W-56 TaxID=2897325 RepID=UPI0021CF1A7B|nr:BPSL0067 family protein [Undibacterium sp. Jales W-56]MCU6432928.1 BPSL0067 family protein [Undibacterium sp. Jales W-56]
MPYIFEEAEILEGQPPLGSKQCVALVKEFAKAPAASLWREGDVVRKNLSLKKGTAIATFVDGKYPNHGSGNHAALYLAQDALGIWVIDQWAKSGTIQKRRLSFKGKDKDGNYVDPSNNGDAFSVIK